MGNFEAINGNIRGQSWESSTPLMGHFENIDGSFPGH